ncbi:MAG: cbb3-type cytochrome c oxidase subunit I [Candidatus Sericytochromatia bacterium]|nr:cbb3-type cytochrome c oxidase subunit I [Candidatus Sericytochromatia bacterium]
MAVVSEKAISQKEEVVDKKLVRMSLYYAFVWLLVGMLGGVLTSIKFNYPDFLGYIPWLAFGRLRVFHLNGVAFGWFTTAAFGMAYYMVPKLTGIKMVWPKVSYVVVYSWAVVSTIGQISLLAGYSQGVEVGEWPVWVDVPVSMIFALITTQIFFTIANRKEKHIYVSLWYLTAGFTWSTINYVLGNLINPYFFAGVDNAAIQGFYLHSVVGLWITPMGTAMLYYFMPVITKNPVYSHKLSMIGFWGLALFYPFTGAHHYLFSPIDTWVQTIAIMSSMMLIMPVWSVITNQVGTMKGKWHMLSSHIEVKFMVLGAVFYVITCFQGPTQALRSMQQIIHFTDWVVGHAHLAIYGVFTMWTWAGIYYIWPKLTGRQIYSQKLSGWHFWLSLVGFAIMALTLWGAGLVQGGMLNLESNVAFIDTVKAISPFWAVRTVGGTLMMLGAACFVYNMYMTAKVGRLVDEDFVSNRQEVLV